MPKIALIFDLEKRNRPQKSILGDFWGLFWVPQKRGSKSVNFGHTRLIFKKKKFFMVLRAPSRYFYIDFYCDENYSGQKQNHVPPPPSSLTSIKTVFFIEIMGKSRFKPKIYKKFVISTFWLCYRNSAKVSRSEIP